MDEGVEQTRSNHTISDKASVTTARESHLKFQLSGLRHGVVVVARTLGEKREGLVGVGVEEKHEVLLRHKDPFKKELQ